jgi:5-methylcytosine-specific restriction endonuclease McrA
MRLALSPEARAAGVGIECGRYKRFHLPAVASLWLFSGVGTIPVQEPFVLNENRFFKGVVALGQRVLVLNASYEPLQLISVRRAVILLLQEKAELVEAAQQQLRARAFSLDVPLVIRLMRYIKIPRRLKLPCSRRGIFARDRETCQYCGAQPGRQHLTMDHVVPRSQGGLTTWENVVTACRECNHKKGGRTPEQANMLLMVTPRQPQYVAFALMGELERHDVWRKYAFS